HPARPRRPTPAQPSRRARAPARTPPPAPARAARGNTRSSRDRAPHLAVTTPKATSSRQRRSICRDERSPIADAYSKSATIIFGSNAPAPAIAAADRVERTQIKLLDSVNHKPGKTILRQPLAQARRQQQLPLTLTSDEVEGHRRLPPAEEQVTSS